jgi:hypothetical protein
LKANAVLGSGPYPPGVWFGSAAAMRAMSPAQVSERSIQRTLARLDRLGLIRRWVSKGKHGNYAILVARHSVADRSGKQYIVNAEDTEDWRNPKLELVGESSSVMKAADSMLSGIKETRLKKQNQECCRPSEDDFKPATTRKP